MNTTIEFCIFELVLVPNFGLNWQFWFIGSSLPKKGVSGLNTKSKYHHCILHIRISLGNKLQVKLRILIFWTKLVQKGEFQSEANKVNIIIVFCIFELVWVPNFGLNRKFWHFGPNLPKKVFPIGNGKIALVRTSMVVTYYIKPFRTGADKHKGILMSLLLLVAKPTKYNFNFWCSILIYNNFFQSFINKIC